MSIRKNAGILADQKLWTRDFTILTLGSVISNLGNVITGFAMALLVLEFTGSTFLYSLFMAANMLPQIIVPLFAGPFLDRFSRRKAIYTLDFISTGMFAVFSVVIGLGFLNYPVIIVCCLMLGIMNSIYTVAYESFYPMLVSKGNYSKAYSISSTLTTLTTVMTPVSAFLYNLVGIVPLLVLDAVSFFIAACFETRIKAKEDYTLLRKDEIYGFKKYKRDFVEGLKYIKTERALAAVTAYFFVNFIAQAVYDILMLPYFKGTYPVNGEYIFMLVTAFCIAGRAIGGVVHYKIKIKPSIKYALSIAVYVTICVINSFILFTPIIVMQILIFIVGFIGVTSYNIRISATQSYVPDEKKARFNGFFSMTTTCGTLIGNLLGGAISEFLPVKAVIIIFMSFNLIVGVFLIMLPNKRYVKELYNKAL
ncbi:MAG: MFS transporter [Clostridiales bacterium]|nr:MFS transporter [Clostridiales bacterium]